jgi:hypothetical protein
VTVTRFRTLLLLIACVAVFGLGCGRAQRNEDFVPTEDAARAALDATLQLWASGDTSQEVPHSKPVIMVSDGHRTQKRKLTAYSILGPTPADAPRCFAVQLRLGNPSADIRERYVVVGIDPIWVVRYEDYEMLTHWSHPMTPATKK